jgi:hypothetical protein
MILPISCAHKDIKTNIIKNNEKDKECLQKCQSLLEKYKLEKEEKNKEYFDFCKNIENYFLPVILNKTKNPNEFIINSESIENLKYNINLMKECIINITN